ncbi:MAG TPA: hypothetical protein ENH55_04205 [Aurantimonas coralicida]|uniref:Uncharacterized protein n=2 Tax=root TaxID=1 RepID=A0A9C9TJ62_9HYPH|nr:hypothetical protein [Aurantimonas coralicida]HEU03064.1 hypothetical protein [Aurantimonas coralicida]
MKFLILAATSFFLALPAMAQEQVTAKSGEEVRVGWIGSVGENCQTNPLPAITPAELAKHGQIRLTEGEVQTDTVPNCPGIKIPAIVVFYTSSPGFTGTDNFALSTGEGQPSRTYTITVQ